MSPKRLLILILPVLALLLLWKLYDPPAGDDVATDPTSTNQGQDADEGDALESKADASGSGSQKKAVDAAAERREAVENSFELPRLIGRVVDDLGQPVANAKVLCRNDPDLDAWTTSKPPDMMDAKRLVEKWRESEKARHESRTDSDGRFHVAAPAGTSDLNFEVRARGHIVLKRLPTRPTTQDVDLGELTLDRAGVIAGKVVDASDQPIADARVRRSVGNFGDQFEDMEVAGIEDFGGSGRESIRTDRFGRFEIAHAKPGKFQLRATHAKHPPSSTEGLSVARGEVMADVVIVMTAGVQITGRISDVPTGMTDLRVLAQGKSEKSNPLAALGFDPMEMMGSMGFAMGDRTATVDADGKFVLNGLKPDTAYKIWAVHEGTGVLQMSPCTDPVEVRGGALGVQLRYVEGVAVTMVVIDARTNKPLTDLKVNPKLEGGGLFEAAFAQAMGSSAKFESYPDGRVTLTNLRPKQKQTLNLEIEALGHAPFARKKIELPARGKIDLGTIRLASAPVLRVLVTDEKTSKPVSGAQVQLVVDTGDEPASRIRSRVMVNTNNRLNISDLGGRRRLGRTDGKGVCLLNSYPGESVIVKVEARDRAPYESDPFAASVNKDGEHSAALEVGGSVEVLVFDTENNPLPEIGVERRGPGGEETVTSDAKGLVRFEHLATGLHGFRLGDRPSGGGGFTIGLNIGTRGSSDKKDEGWKDLEVFDEKLSHLTLTRTGFGMLGGIVRENGVPLRGAKVKLVPGRKDADGRGEMEELMALTEQLEGMLSGGTSSGKTSKSGRYKIDKVPVGEHRLRITHANRLMPTIVPVKIELGKNKFDIELQTTSLAGRVLGPDGEPIDGATVEVTSSSSKMNGQMLEIMRGATEMFGGGLNFGGGAPEIKTDDNGEFELRGLRAGTALVVRVRASGFTRSSTKVTLREGEARRGFDVRLVVGGKIRIKVNGKIPAIGTISATFADDSQKVDPTMGILKDGRCTLRGLRPGRWKVTLTGVNLGEDQTKPVTKEVVVVAGESTRLEFDL